MGLNKISIIILSLIIATAVSNGQDTSKTGKDRELYFAPLSVSPFTLALKYKKQLGETAYMKLGLIDIYATEGFFNPADTSSFSTAASYISVGLELGLEFRKRISEELSLFHGPNINLIFNTNSSKVDDPTIPESQRKIITETYTGGLPYTLGFLYEFNHRVLLTGEINPGLFYTEVVRMNNSNPEYNYKTGAMQFRFSNQSGLFSLGYRI